MQIEENKKLEKEIAELRETRLRLDELGTVADAALKLNGVFEAAQKAADDYLNEARYQAQRIVERAHMEAEIFNGTRTVENKNKA